MGRRGKEFYVMGDDGELHDVECALSQKHDEFRMRKDSKIRTIPMRDIVNVRSSQEASGLNLGYVPDSLCATLELQTGECITTKFGHAEACDRFILGMRLLAEQKRPRFNSRSFSNATLQAGGQDGNSDVSSAGTSAVSLPVQGSMSARSAGSMSARKTGDDAREAVEVFVQQMVNGCSLSVVGSKGKQQVHCSMDKELTLLTIKAGDASSRDLRMADIAAIHTGKEASKLGLGHDSTTRLCATVQLSSGACLTLCFPDETQRDRFVTCIRLFSSAHQQQ